MFNKNLLHFVTSLGKRVLTLYLLFFLLFHIFADENKIKAKTLNSLKPESFNYLINLENNSAPSDEKKTASYIRYFKKIIQYMPSVSGAYGLLGFCYYQEGKLKEAAFWYKKAHRSHPNTFLFYYSLGIIHFKNQDYPKAIQYLENAASLNTEDYLNFTTSTKIYLPLLDISDESMNTLSLRFKTHLSHCHTLLAMGYYYSKDFSNMFGSANHAISLGLPDQGFFYYLAGLAAYEQQKHEIAIKFFMESLKNNFKHPKVHHYLGLSLKNMGKGPEAKKFIIAATPQIESFDLLQSEADKITLPLY